MKVKILRNLAGPYPAFKEGEVREVESDLAAKMLAVKLAEETNEPLTKDVEEDPQPISSSAAPITAALEAREFEQMRAGGALPAALASPTRAQADDLESQTVADLHETARKESINLHGATAKDDIVKTIRKARKK